MRWVTWLATGAYTCPLLSSTLDAVISEPLQPHNVSHKKCSRQAERLHECNPLTGNP